MTSTSVLQQAEVAHFDEQHRIVSWRSSHVPSVAVMRRGGGSPLFQKSFAAAVIRRIHTVAVDERNVVAIIIQPATGGDSVAVRFCVAGVWSETSNHVSSPASNENSRWLSLATTSGPSMGQGCVVFSNLDLPYLYYCFRRGNACSDIKVFPLDAEVVNVVRGPAPQTIVCVLRNGTILTLAVSDDDTGLLSFASPAVDSGCGNIISVAASGNQQMLWLLTQDGRLMAYENAAAAVTNQRDGGGGVIAWQRHTFRSNNQPELSLAGFTVSTNGKLCSDADARHVYVASFSQDASFGSLELTCVVLSAEEHVGVGVGESFATVSSIHVAVDACGMLDFVTHRNGRTWEFLMKSSKQDYVERILLDMNADFAAHSEFGNASDHNNSALTVPPKYLCCEVAWLDVSQLAIQRERCERYLRTLEQLYKNQLSPSSRQEGGTEFSVRGALAHVVSLQHSALAFLRREQVESGGDLTPTNSFSNNMLQRLRSIYIRLKCHELLLVADGYSDNNTTTTIHIGLSLDVQLQSLFSKPVGDGMPSASSIRADFFRVMKLDPQAEHPVDQLEIWGYNDAVRFQHRSESTVFDILMRELSVSSTMTLRDLLALFNPSTHTSPALDVSMLSSVLLYCVCCVASRRGGTSSVSKTDLESRVSDLLRLLDVPQGLWHWAQVCWFADCGSSLRSEQNEGDSQVINVGSLLSAGHAPLDLTLPRLNILLPALVNGLVVQGEKEAALQLVRLSFAVYPRGGMSKPLAVKALYLALLAGDCALILQLVQQSSGTSWMKLAVQALVLLYEKLALSGSSGGGSSSSEGGVGILGTLGVGGLIQADSACSKTLEDVLYGRLSAASSSSSSSVSEETTAGTGDDATHGFATACVLCDWLLATSQFEAAEAVLNGLSRTCPPSCSQRFAQLREYLLAHSSREASSSSSPMTQRSIIPSSANRRPSCLRENDETLNRNAKHAAPCATARAPLSTTIKRPVTGGSATAGLSRSQHAEESTSPWVSLPPLHMGGSTARSVHALPEAPHSSALLCSVSSCGVHAVACGQARPCPFHEPLQQ